MGKIDLPANLTPGSVPRYHPDDAERDRISRENNPTPADAGKSPREDVTHGWPKENK